MNEMKLGMTIRPDYHNLTADVAIPSPERDQHNFPKDINYVESCYAQKRDEAQRVKEKVYYDKAKAVCKFAGACGAKIESQYVKQGRLHFVFSFSSLESLKMFNQEANHDINASSMTAEDVVRVKGRR